MLSRHEFFNMYLSILLSDNKILFNIEFIILVNYASPLKYVSRTVNIRGENVEFSILVKCTL